jgi:hypothetical protein
VNGGHARWQLALHLDSSRIGPVVGNLRYEATLGPILTIRLNETGRGKLLGSISLGARHPDPILLVRLVPASVRAVSNGVEQSTAKARNTPQKPRDHAESSDGDTVRPQCPTGYNTGKREPNWTAQP